jgi:hypothetical protein
MWVIERRTEGLRFRLGRWMEQFGALGVLLLGLAMLTTA